MTTPIPKQRSYLTFSKTPKDTSVLVVSRKTNPKRNQNHKTKPQPTPKNPKTQNTHPTTTVSFHPKNNQKQNNQEQFINAAPTKFQM
jgi:hypothetical protein